MMAAQCLARFVHFASLLEDSKCETRTGGILNDSDACFGTIDPSLLVRKLLLCRQVARGGACLEPLEHPVLVVLVGRCRLDTQTMDLLATDDLHRHGPRRHIVVGLETLTGLEPPHDCDGIMVDELESTVVAWLTMPVAWSASIVNTESPGCIRSRLIVRGSSIGHFGRMALLPCLRVATDVLQHGFEVIGVFQM